MISAITSPVFAAGEGREGAGGAHKYRTFMKGLMALALNLTEENFESEVLKSAIPVLVDFWAPWCGPCRSMAPIIEDLAKEFDGKVKVGKVNVDENKNLAGNYGIMSIPTLILFKNGQNVGQMVGYTAKSALVKKIDGLVEG